MKKIRCTEEHIAFALKQAETGPRAGYFMPVIQPSPSSPILTLSLFNCPISFSPAIWWAFLCGQCQMLKPTLNAIYDADSPGAVSGWID
ncbi:hypothetical protein ACL2XG_10520 [Sodalis sp. RH24]|uniref:hypothetical protein n=1 Tax=unclassified Sodalis (in: enterobacteria) TaxID=2636512 RepID=UPI0039B6A1DA